MVSNKLLKIDILNYISPRNRIFLRPDFRLNLFKGAIKNAGTKRKLSELIDVGETSLYEWKVGKKRPPLDKTFLCGNIAGIGNDKVLENAYAITAYLVPGSISIENWKIEVDKTMAEWFGLLKGDGSITKYNLRFCNNDVSLVFFFANHTENTFAIPKRRMEITIRLPTHENREELNMLIQKLKLDGFERINIASEKNRKFIRREPNLQLRISSAVLSELVSHMQSDMKNILEKSDNEVKAGYIRGFAAAEGCVNVCRGQRSVSIAQANRETLEFIKTLLKDIGINSGNCLQGTNALQMYITTRKEIEKFKNLIGFGHHAAKNKKLEEILAGYRQDMPYKTPKSERYADILKLIENKSVTCKDLSAALNLKCGYVNKLLKEMLKRNMIQVDKSNKVLVYRDAEKKMRAELEEDVKKVCG